VKTRINSPLAASSSIGIAPVPDIDFSQFGEIEEIPRTRVCRNRESAPEILTGTRIKPLRAF